MKTEQGVRQYPPPGEIVNAIYAAHRTGDREAVRGLRHVLDVAYGIHLSIQRCCQAVKQIPAPSFE